MEKSDSVPFPDKPCQPRNVIFPKKSFGKSVQKEYSFQVRWFDSWKWLHWDDGKKAVFCHTCTLAWHSGKLTFSKNAEAAFITKGFQNWKDATRLFRNHEQSKCHTEAVEKVVRLPLLMLVSCWLASLLRKRSATGRCFSTFYDQFGFLLAKACHFVVLLHLTSPMSASQTVTFTSCWS